MDIRTGEIYTQEESKKIKMSAFDGIVCEANDTMYFPQHAAPIKRDLTETEKANKQINLYQPCGCGSNKKFKFCCHKL